MSDPIHTPAEALSSGPALIEWCGADGMRWGNALQTAIALNYAIGVDDLGEWFGGWFCNAIETARDIDKSRIAAPDDEALVKIAQSAAVAAWRTNKGSISDTVDAMGLAVLAALDKAGALR